MALITQTFSEYYTELVERPVTYEEMFHDIHRGEYANRQRIENDEWSDFRDMLHVAGVWIGQKKEREKGGGPRLDQFAMALYEKQREIWFPTAPPRQVTSGRMGFPKKAYRALCEEEEELRRWLHGVEGRLRENIERSCQDSYYVLTCFDHMYEMEERGRIRIAKEESEAYAAIRKKLFMVAPADYYRQKVIERYGSTFREPSPPRELTFEETEEWRRSLIEADEVEGRKNTFQYLQDVYAAQLYMVHHQEIVKREDLFVAEREARYPVISSLCKKEFGLGYYNTPAVALHVANSLSTPLLFQLCTLQILENARKSAAVKQEMADSRNGTLGQKKQPQSEMEVESSRSTVAPEEEQPPLDKSVSEADLVAQEEELSTQDNVLNEPGTATDPNELVCDADADAAGMDLINNASTEGCEPPAVEESSEPVECSMTAQPSSAAPPPVEEKPKEEEAEEEAEASAKEEETPEEPEETKAEEEEELAAVEPAAAEADVTVEEEYPAPKPPLTLNYLLCAEEHVPHIPGKK